MRSETIRTETMQPQPVLASTDSTDSSPSNRLHVPLRWAARASVGKSFRAAILSAHLLTAAALADPTELLGDQPTATWATPRDAFEEHPEQERSDQEPSIAPAKREAKKEGQVEDPLQLVRQRLHGDWTLVAGINQGRKLTAKELEGSHLVINDNTLVVLDAGAKELYKASYELEVAMDDKPHRINMTSEIPNAPEKMAFGILQFTKQGWKLAYGLPGAARPRDFTSPAGSRSMVFEMVAVETKAPLIPQQPPFTAPESNPKTDTPR